MGGELPNGYLRRELPSVYVLLLRQLKNIALTKRQLMFIGLKARGIFEPTEWVKDLRQG